MLSWRNRILIYIMDTEEKHRDRMEMFLSSSMK